MIQIELTEISSYTEAGTIRHAGEPVGDWTIEAIEGDNAVLDATISASSADELRAAIATLQSLIAPMEHAEAFRGTR